MRTVSERTEDRKEDKNNEGQDLCGGKQKKHTRIDRQKKSVHFFYSEKPWSQRGTIRTEVTRKTERKYADHDKKESALAKKISSGDGSVTWIMYADYGEMLSALSARELYVKVPKKNRSTEEMLLYQVILVQLVAAIAIAGYFSLLLQQSIKDKSGLRIYEYGHIFLSQFK